MPKFGLVSLFIFCLISCGGNGYRAPVEQRHNRPEPIPRSYLVQRGDTLYSIAFRYGLDYRAFAAANNISSSYTIYPGQKLLLQERAPAKKVAAASPAKKPSAWTPKKSPAKSAAKPAPKSIPKPVSSTKPAAIPKAGAPKSSATVAAWRWPTTGKVVRNYSSSVHKGIDISGEKGDPIYAVAAGQVVYAGTGIVGFGELLIVKHNELYLSAYGHNSRLLVDEGETVKAGQKIAEKGSSGTNTTKLHFEIRKEGKPIDPKKLLP